MADAPAILFSRFMVVGNDLRIGSNVLIDFSKTTFNEGVTMGQVIFDANDPNKTQVGSEIASKLIGTDRFSPPIPIFVYEALLSIPNGVTEFEVTVQDMSGNEVTMPVTCG